MSKLSARELRTQRKARIAARKQAHAGDPGGLGGEDMPDWLEDKIENGDEDENGNGNGDGDASAMPPMGDDYDEDMPPDEGMPGDTPDEDEEDMPGDLPDEAGVYSAFNYNPVYQKPTQLGNQHQGRGHSGYHYFGPPPDAGTSYGFFAEAGSKVGIIAPLPAKGKKVHSPVSGKVMKLTGKLDTEALASILSVADRMKTVGKYMTSANLPEAMPEAEPLFDPESGDALAMEEPLAPDMPRPDPLDGDEMPPMDDEDEMPPTDDEDEMPPMGDEGDAAAEGTEYEALQSLDEVGEVAENDVHMTLFDEGPNQEPYWNVDIGGTPMARVYLSDQPKPDEIREVFCSEDYVKGVSQAIEKVGIKPVFQQINAKLWVNKVLETSLAKGIKAKVDAEAQARVNAVTQNLMGDLLRCTAIVCAGMDKNFYREVGNPLKEALYTEMKRYGIANPAPIIEAAFKKGSTEYFQTVLAQAVTYLEYDPKALADVQAAIGDMDVMPPGDDVVGDELPEVDAPSIPIPGTEDATLSERLAASSVAVAGMQGLTTGNPIGEHKDRLRAELRLGGAGPRRR